MNIPMEAFQEFCRAKTNFYIFEKVGRGPDSGGPRTRVRSRVEEEVNAVDAAEDIQEEAMEVLAEESK